MNTTAHGMPKGIFSLYWIQMFSTFSFAVLYSSLSLYITKQLGLSSTLSNSIVGLFLAFNYVLHLVGGALGGNWLSNRFVFLFTTLLQTFGIVFFIFPNQTALYWGLSLFLIGCGLNTTSFNTILTQRFSASDSRRDKAFFYSYSAMNVGFWAGYIFSGLYDSSSQYQPVFYASIITNLITLFLIMRSWSYLGDVDTPLNKLAPQTRSIKNGLGILLTLLLIPFLLICFHYTDLSNGLVVLISLMMFGVLLLLAYRQKTIVDRQKIIAFLILTVTSIVFWMIYFTSPMGVTLFIKNNVDRHFLNYEFATQWIININSIVVIIGSPLLAALLTKLQKQGYSISVSSQFILSFVSLGIAFFFLSVGVSLANSQGYSSLTWTVLYQVALAIAELLIGPVGYAMIGRIAPNHLQGLLMGTWMMVSGVSAAIAQYFSNAMVTSESVNPLLSNTDFQHVFNQLTIWAFLGGVLLFLLSGILRTFMNESPSRTAPIEVATN